MHESDEIRDAFRAYREATVPQIKPLGADGVTTALRHRRRNRTVGLGIAAVVLASIPFAGPLLRQPEPAAPPKPWRPSTGMMELNKPQPAPPGLDRDELMNSMLDIPAWNSTIPGQVGCPAGRLRPDFEDNGIVLQPFGAYGFIDGDHQQDAVYIVQCQRDRQASRWPTQVVAFSRDKDNRVRTIGQVMSTRDGVLSIGCISDYGLEIQVCVGNGQPLGRPTASQQQRRGFTWDGKTFKQTSGATAFAAATTVGDLRMTTTPLTFTRREDGVGLGLSVATIHNAGPGRIEKFLLRVSFEDVYMGAGSGDGLPRSAENGDWGIGITSVWRQFDGLAEGESRDVDLHFALPPDWAQKPYIRLDAIRLDGNGTQLADSHPGNNAEIPIVIK